LRQVALRRVAAVVGAAAGKLRRLSPLDLRVERRNGRVHVTAIERHVCFAKGKDCLCQAGGFFHARFLLRLEASAQQNGCNNRDNAWPSHLYLSKTICGNILSEMGWDSCEPSLFAIA
jgi:hypothetical protein